LHGTGNVVEMTTHLMKDENFQIILKSNPGSTDLITYNTEVYIWSVHAEQYLSCYIAGPEKTYKYKSIPAGDETFKLMRYNDIENNGIIDDTAGFGILCGKHYASWDGNGSAGPEMKTHLEAYEKWALQAAS
jgi:hypothetical protein